MEYKLYFLKPTEVIVSEYTLPNERMKIRALTPRAAARKYIRGNLASDLTKVHVFCDTVYDNYYPDQVKDKEMISNYKQYAKTAIIKIIKDKK